METLEDKLNHLINQILLKAENQHELLIGQCRSDIKMTNTQEHILMLLAQGQKTNSELAKILNISQAAVTKAIKSLVRLGMLESRKDDIDGRVTYFELTKEAQPIALEHREHHEATMEVYRDLLRDFDAKELQTIERFLLKLESKIEE
ncbi:zinc-dependent MarR family transcriptional regulator [Streptococcus dentiloxodontae]